MTQQARHPLIQETFSPSQQAYLQEIHEMCLAQGATSKQLVPLRGLIDIDWRHRLTEAEIQTGIEVAKKYGLFT